MSDWNEAEELSKLLSVESIQGKLKIHRCGGGVVVLCLGARYICQEIILEAISNKIFELNGHSEDARKLSNYVDLVVASGAGVIPALPISRFHLDINDTKEKNAALARMNSKHRPLSSNSLRALDQETWVENMIKKSNPDRIPGHVPVIRHHGDIETCQGAFVLEHTEPQQDKTTTNTVWVLCMARTYELTDNERHKDLQRNLRTLAPIDKDFPTDEYFPLLHLPQAAMAARGVLPSVRVGDRRYKSHVSSYSNPVMLGISEAVTLYNMRAGEALQRTDLGGVAAVISIGSGIKKPAWPVHPLRRRFYGNAEKVNRSVDPTMHEQARIMLENAGKPYRSYYRFDPPSTRFPNSKRSKSCELYDWSKVTRVELEELTKSYLADPRIKMQIEELARFLIAIKMVRNSSTKDELYSPQSTVELDIQPVTQAIPELCAHAPNSQDFRASNRTQSWPHHSRTIIPRQEATRESEDTRSMVRRRTENDGQILPDSTQSG